MSTSPIKIFISYAREDKDALNALLECCQGMQNDGRATIWFDSDIPLGDAFDEDIKREMESSNLILLLVSRSFVASEYITKYELPSAERLHGSNEAHIVPIFLEVPEYNDPFLASLQGVPRNRDKEALYYLNEDQRRKSWLKITNELAKTVASVEAKREQRVRRRSAWGGFVVFLAAAFAYRSVYAAAATESTSMLFAIAVAVALLLAFSLYLIARHATRYPAHRSNTLKLYQPSISAMALITLFLAATLYAGLSISSAQACAPFAGLSLGSSVREIWLALARSSPLEGALCFVTNTYSNTAVLCVLAVALGIMLRSALPFRRPHNAPSSASDVFVEALRLGLIFSFLAFGAAVTAGAPVQVASDTDYWKYAVLIGGAGFGGGFLPRLLG